MKKTLLFIALALISCEKTNPEPNDPTPAVDCNCGTIVYKGIDGSVYPATWLYRAENACSGNVERVYPPSNVEVGDYWCNLTPW